MTGKPAFYAKPPFVALGILGFLLSLSACTGERSKPGGPEAQVRLAALDIAENPVLAITGMIAPTDTIPGDTTEYRFQISDSMRTKVFGIDDILITHAWYGFQIYDYDFGEWRTLDSYDRDGVRESSLLTLPYFQTFLKKYSDDLEKSFLGDAGLLRIRSRGTDFFCRLVTYHPHYEPILLPDLRDAIPMTLAVVGSQIWAVVAFPAGESWAQWEQSVLVVDFDGTIVDSFVLAEFSEGDPMIYSLAEGNGEVWVLTRTQDGFPHPSRGLYTFNTVADDHSLVPRFVMPRRLENLHRVTSSIVWAMGRLFVSAHAKLLGILTGPSVESGEAVVDWPLSLGPDFRGARGITWDGGYFHLRNGSHLGTFNLSRTQVASYKLSVDGVLNQFGRGGRGLGAVAWDGEALWMLHYGPQSLSGPSLMLSRFKLPEDAR